MIPNEVLIILMFVALVGGIVFLGAHLAFVLGIIALVAGSIGWGNPDFLALFPLKIWQILNNYVLVACPLFVFMGYMLERSGFGEDLFGGIEYFFGIFRGGMAVTVILVTTLLAACTGIVATGVILAGVLALPVMLRRGYDKGLAYGTVAAGGTLGVLIPPSILLVFYASQTGLSVGKLFLAAFGPGFLLSTLFITYIIFITTIRPKMAPRAGEVPERTEYGAIAPRIETRHPRLRTLRGVVPVVVLIFAVLGSIVVGFATPTEAAAAGAAGAILVSVAYRKITYRSLKQSCVNTVGTMGMVGGVIMGAMAFTCIFNGLGGRDILYDFVMGLGMAPLVVLLVILFIVVILGMFIDAIAIVLLLVPTILPMQLAMGWDELWFGMLVCVTLQTAWLSPPFGAALFFLRGLNYPGVNFGHIAKGCVPFILLQLIGVGICIAFPQLILWLPSLFIK